MPPGCTGVGVGGANTSFSAGWLALCAQQLRARVGAVASGGARAAGVGAAAFVAAVAAVALAAS